jgi:enamine deaminase RidA (YjgF/YER057c/UK114 family)
MNNPVHITVAERFGRLTASSGSSWEPKMGYSRAVRSGNIIAVTGTVGINADGTWPASLAGQTERSLQIILAALDKLGGKPEHVIRTRIYTTQIDKWEEIASVHGRIFADIRPATTLLGVSKLIDDAALIEIEVDAVVG